MVLFWSSVPAHRVGQRQGLAIVEVVERPPSGVELNPTHQAEVVDVAGIGVDRGRSRPTALLTPKSAALLGAQARGRGARRRHAENTVGVTASVGSTTVNVTGNAGGEGLVRASGGGCC